MMRGEFANRFVPIRAIRTHVGSESTRPSEICANFFSWRESASGSAIPRRRSGARSAVNGLVKRPHSSFLACKKCPFRGRFCNCVLIGRVSRKCLTNRRTELTQ